MANGDFGASALGIGAQNEAKAGGSLPSSKWVSELGRLSRGQRTERRLVERARMVLSTLDGSIYAASRRLGCSKNTVRKWRDRVALLRRRNPDAPVARALRDAIRSERPPECSEAQFVARARLTPRPPGAVFPAVSPAYAAWGIVVAVPAEVAGEARHVTTDEGQDLRVVVPAPDDADPKAVLAAAKYWELPPPYVRSLAHVAAVPVEEYFY